MHKIALALTVLFTTLGSFLAVGPAHAQATRTWISGVGDDVNPCSRTAPCKTFAGAISKTAVNGEINCLDPGGFGAVTITKSITLDCHEIYGSILVSGSNGIIINYDSFQAADTRKTVRIRNLNFNGANTGLNGIRIIGAANSAGSSVFIEDCLIDGFFGAPGRGISDERSGGGELYVTNTTVRNNGATGIAIIPASGATNIRASINNVRVQNSNIGLQAGNGTRVMILNSVFSGSTAAGIQADAGAIMNVDNSVSSNNATGVFNNGGTILLSNNNIDLNTTAGITGATQSFTNNRISNNAAAGTVPTPMPGGATNPTGQQ